MSPVFPNGICEARREPRRNSSRPCKGAKRALNGTRLELLEHARDRRRHECRERAAEHGAQAKAREVRGVDRVVIRDGDAIGALLTRLGAHDSVLAWEERRVRREVRAAANRLANFDDANLRRSARAAVAAGARVKRALEILGADAPEHLVAAGALRVQHAQASLEELGALADPPMTKDAVAGRIRRLLAMADKRAADLGIPGTEAGLPADMLVP